MNIFVPYEDIQQNVRMLDDLRLNKMLLEDAQMLCDALRNNGVTEDDFPEIYRPFNPKHPCTLWAGSSSGNFKWLCQHAGYVEVERLYRGQRPNKSLQIVRKALEFLPVIPEGERTPFVNCTADYKDISCVYTAYQHQLHDKWHDDRKRPTWTKREPPAFYGGWHGDEKWEIVNEREDISDR